MEFGTNLRGSSVVAPGSAGRNGRCKRFTAESAYLDDRPAAPMQFRAEANVIIRREEQHVEAADARAEWFSNSASVFVARSRTLRKGGVRGSGCRGTGRRPAPPSSGTGVSARLLALLRPATHRRAEHARHCGREQRGGDVGAVVDVVGEHRAGVADRLRRVDVEQRGGGAALGQSSMRTRRRSNSSEGALATSCSTSSSRGPGLSANGRLRLVRG